MGWKTGGTDLRESRLQWHSVALAAALLAGALPASPAMAQESLCEAGEPVVFSCHIGGKTLSLCRPSSVRQELIYRFGTQHKLELAYPGPGRHAAPAAFETASRPLYGGGVTTVSFRRGAWEYRVYSKTGRSGDSERTPEFEDGVTILRNGKTVKTLVCDDGGAGFREPLDWLPRRTRR